jgi:hypothetical protein
MELLIESDIKYWVFLPIIVGLILFSKLRTNLQRLFGGSPTAKAAVKTDAAFKDKVSESNK